MIIRRIVWPIVPFEPIADSAGQKKIADRIPKVCESRD
jgi:hypothetical protein